MKYQLGTVIFEEIGGGYYLASLPTRTIKLALFELLAMRATPINDKPEAYAPEEEWGDKSKLRFDYQDKPECNPDWKGQHMPDCQCHHQTKQEKIEPISYLEIHNKWSNDSELFMNKMNEIIKAVNSLKEE